MTEILSFLSSKIITQNNQLLLASCFKTLELLTNENKIIAQEALTLIPNLKKAIFTDPYTVTNI